MRTDTDTGTDTVPGTVTSFDDPRGLGTVTTDDGRALLFHCTAIVDGSRTIREGAEVSVEVGPGLPGRWEAVRVRPVDARRGAGST